MGISSSDLIDYYPIISDNDKIINLLDIINVINKIYKDPIKKAVWEKLKNAAPFAQNFKLNVGLCSDFYIDFHTCSEIYIFPNNKWKKSFKYTGTGNNFVYAFKDFIILKEKDDIELCKVLLYSYDLEMYNFLKS